MELSFLYYIPILIFSIVVHEVAHGWVALKCGDTTARDMGRLTLNPIPHLDPVGSILMPLLGFFSGGFLIGWAKPVPVNPHNLRNWKRDDILVTAAGPASNIMLTFICTGFAILFAIIGRSMNPEESSMGYKFIEFLYLMFIAGINLNIVLALFNMLPIPPLDGSHIVANFLPAEAAFKFRRIGFFGIFILLILFNYIPGFARLFYGIILTIRSPFIELVNYFS